MKNILISKELAKIQNRTGSREALAYKYLTSLFDGRVAYATQAFISYAPKFTKAKLIVDGVEIKCLPSGLVSGVINDKVNLISNLTSSQNFIDLSNINFNPKSDAISVSNYYFAPSLCISRKDVQKIIKGSKIDGQISVIKNKFTAKNILVGNSKNPKTIIFTHYDAYFNGAIDNASGVGVLAEIVLNNPTLLEDNLFVFAGNEEISYDYPIYWGRGYRQFCKSNEAIIKSSKKVLVIDSVGQTEAKAYSDSKFIKLAFPIGDELKTLNKVTLIAGDYDSLMPVYHSASDVKELLVERYLDQAAKLLVKLIK